jgi:catechol 2,3-dioxygenase-like lactoylglutathione lyase family enzyme
VGAVDRLLRERAVNVLFCAGFAPIVRDPEPSLAFYRDALGLPLGDGDYPSTGEIDGLKHFGLWRLSDAARSCFDVAEWPSEVPAPQGCVEFEVDDLVAATNELRASGCEVLVGPRTEPWGQQVSRLLSPEGLLIGVTVTPGLRSDEASQ